LCVASDEQYKSIPDDKIALLARKFQTLYRFRKERRSPRGCFECGDTTHFINDCPKRKKFDSSNKYNNQNESSDKGEGKKKYYFGDKKKKKFQNMMSRACAALSDLNFSATTPPASRRMRGPSTKRATSPAFASWASRRGTSPTLTSV
jgi:hypothetical protein